MNQEHKLLLEKLLKKHICRDERLGGFTAENYIVHTDDEQKYVVKFLRNAFDNYIDKLQSVNKIIKTDRQRYFVPPQFIDTEHKLVVLPYLEGIVLHGADIKKHYYKPISKLFKKLKQQHVNSGLKHSLDLYYDIDNSIKKLNSVTKKLKSTDSYVETVQNIIKLKQEILSKYKQNTALYNWLADANDFVHGDFHNENILFTKYGISSVLDFELVHRGHSAEDMINFVWFAFLNSDLSDENLKKSADFLEVCKETTGVTNRDLKYAFEFTFLRFLQSSVLENSLIDYKESFFEGLLQRDIKKFRYIDEHKQEILAKLLNETV